jgi:hypothetical protein
MKQAASKGETSKACCLHHYDFLLGLLFKPEDGGDIFLQNIS